MECLKQEEIYEYVKKQYGTIPEYLWKSSPESAILRHKNGKWYAAILRVEKSKLGLDRIDGYNHKNLGQIGEDSIKSALLGMLCSLPGGLIQAGTLNENILEELMVNYTKSFGNQLNNFFGIVDNFLLDITMGGCYNE